MIVITGAAGYIGEELCKHLLAKGEDIVQIDNEFWTPLEYAITEKAELMTYATCIVHLAAISGIKACEDDPRNASMSNELATSMIMKFASDNNIPLIFASSAAAANPTSSFYAGTKFAGETLAEFYNVNHDANITVLRFSNVYGGDNYLKKKDSVIARFLNRKNAGEHLIVDGDGSQTRDFIHVKRIIEVIDRLIYKTDNKLFEYSEPINVCTGSQMGIDYLAFWINDGKNVQFKKENRIGVTTAYADPEQIMSLMGSDWCDKCSDDLAEYIMQQCGT